MAERAQQIADWRIGDLKKGFIAYFCYLDWSLKSRRVAGRAGTLL